MGQVASRTGIGIETVTVGRHRGGMTPRARRARDHARAMRLVARSARVARMHGDLRRMPLGARVASHAVPGRSRRASEVVALEALCVSHVDGAGAHPSTLRMKALDTDHLCAELSRAFARDRVACGARTEPHVPILDIGVAVPALDPLRKVARVSGAAAHLAPRPGHWSRRDRGLGTLASDRQDEGEPRHCDSTARSRPPHGPLRAGSWHSTHGACRSVFSLFHPGG